MIQRQRRQAKHPVGQSAPPAGRPQRAGHIQCILVDINLFFDIPAALTKDIIRPRSAPIDETANPFAVLQAIIIAQQQIGGRPAPTPRGGQRLGRRTIVNVALDHLDPLGQRRQGRARPRKAAIGLLADATPPGRAERSAARSRRVSAAGSKTAAGSSSRLPRSVLRASQEVSTLPSVQWVSGNTQCKELCCPIGPCCRA